MRNRISAVLKGGWSGGLLVVALAGCATSPTAQPIPKPHAVLLAPTTVDMLMASGLRSGAPIVHQMIGQLLWEHDMHVDAPPLPEFHELWREAAETTGVQPAPVPGAVNDVAVRMLLDGLRARGENFDTLLVPYLTIRRGTVAGESVRWDGVARRLPFSYKNRDPFLVARQGVVAPCTSLGVVAYGPHGERLFERIGGLEVAKQMWVDGHRRGWNDREDLFQDENALRSGVKEALYPLLTN